MRLWVCARLLPRSSAGHGGAPFDGMNGVAASLLLNLTSSMRFEGALNVDLNEITMNLVPFPRMHYLISSMAPLAAPRDLAQVAPRHPHVRGWVERKG